MDTETTVQIAGAVRDLSALPPMMFFYTKREAADAAVKIGWSKSSALRINLPFGHVRYGISDDHCNVLTLAGYNRLAEAR